LAILANFINLLDNLKAFTWAFRQRRKAWLKLYPVSNTILKWTTLTKTEPWPQSRCRLYVDHCLHCTRSANIVIGRLELINTAKYSPRMRHL